MKGSTIIFCFFLAFHLFAQEPKQVGNLMLEGVPEVSSNRLDRLNQYQNVRSALFQDWHPSEPGMMILTRFSNTNQVHYVSQPGGYRKQMTFLNEPVNLARYSASDKLKGFLYSSDEGGGEFFQFYWFDAATGRSKLLTGGGKTLNRTPVWSHSGKQLAFSSTRRNGKDFDIYLMNAVDPESIRRIKQVEGSWYPLSWSSDDSLLLVQHYISANESYLYTLNPDTGRTSEINSTGGKKKIAYETATFGTGQDFVFYSSDEDSEFNRLTRYDLKAGTKHVLSAHIPWNVDLVDVSSNGEWIAYTANEDGITSLYIGKTSGNAPKIEIPKGVISRLKFDPKNTQLGFQISTSQSPSDVYSVDLATNKLVRWTFSETGGLNDEVFVTPELIHYPTFDQVNGKTRMIPAFYYKPEVELKNGKRLPVIIRIHGGPESQTRASFNSLYQYWVNELGVAVLDPNVRGSDGYGKSYLQLDNGFKREDSVKDIGKLLDWIATRPELDATRVALYGSSYGGYMVLSSFVHYADRIRCAVDIYGISSFVTFLETTESYRRDLRRAEYGDERDPKMKEFLLSISPLTNAAKIKKPLFVIQGKNDPRVPVTEAQQIVQAVRKNGSEVWYLLASDEGHGFSKKENRDYYEAAVSLFFEKYLLH